MTKTTITEQINAIAYDSLTEEQFNFLVERALKSVRKGSPRKGLTKTQKENENIKGTLLETLGEGLTATDAGKAVGISVQKASALLKQLVDAGEVVKEKDGKATIFKVA